MITISSCPQHIQNWLNENKNQCEKIVLETTQKYLSNFKTTLEISKNDSTENLEQLINTHWNFLLQKDFSLLYKSHCLTIVKNIAQTEISISLIQKIYSAIAKNISTHALQTKSKQIPDIVFYIHELVSTDLLNFMSIHQLIEKEKISEQKKIITEILENRLIKNLHDFLTNTEKVSKINDAVLSNSNMCFAKSNYLDNTANQLKNQMNDLNLSIQKLENHINMLKQNIVNDTDFPKNNSDKIKSTANHIKKLALSNEKVSKTVKSIEAIANQANLLSLNANIEAERSADSSKGFTVVAAEIKNIAMHTAEITEDVFSHTEIMENATQNIMNTLSEISNTVYQANAKNDSTTIIVETNITVMNEIKNILQKMHNTNHSFTELLHEVIMANNKIDHFSKQLQNQNKLINSNSKFLINLTDQLKSCEF